MLCMSLGTRVRVRSYKYNNFLSEPGGDDVRVSKLRNLDPRSPVVTLQTEVTYRNSYERVRHMSTHSLLICSFSPNPAADRNGYSAILLPTRPPASSWPRNRSIATGLGDEACSLWTLPRRASGCGGAPNMPCTIICVLRHQSVPVVFHHLVQLGGLMSRQLDLQAA